MLKASQQYGERNDLLLNRNFTGRLAQMFLRMIEAVTVAARPGVTTQELTIAQDEIWGYMTKQDLEDLHEYFDNMWHKQNTPSIFTIPPEVREKMQEHKRLRYELIGMSDADRDAEHKEFIRELIKMLVERRER